jgi:exodeoxyribonuclease V alpha subunit
MKATGISTVVRYLSTELGRGNPEAELAVALASHAARSGHVCADLDLEAGWGPWSEAVAGKAREDFRSRLNTLDIVGPAEAWTPLVWDGRRLYLRRYLDYERQVADDLLTRSGELLLLGDGLEKRLDEVFRDAGQRAAARIALTRRLAVISGGPGTGKTTTLARVIDLLREQAAVAGMAAPHIALAAPTGKAAQRMVEALGKAGVAMPAGGGMTLHRLLGMRPDGSCRHDRTNPLAIDVLVVDEASMIDLSLMARLLAALPARARLILLGDRDQLAAVEAGAVFADVCDSAALAGCVAGLTTSFRFAEGSGIARLAASVRSGTVQDAFSCLSGGHDDLLWNQQPNERERVAAARAGYQAYLAAVAAGASPQELFEHFNAFRVLCAHRHEADAINQALCDGDAGRPFDGMPVMITRNDALLQLFNGDIGLVLADPLDGMLKVCFPGGNGWRWISLRRLQAFVPAWAMTVHKSQGSEFDQVLLALPADDSPVLTRELFYTGVTRARQRVALWANEVTLRAAIARRAERMSGLRDRLGGSRDQLPC